MKVYRIERGKYLDSTLSGIGASKSQGFRWNSLDTFLVYTSESRALASLEVTAHLDLTEDLPSDRFIVEIEIPEETIIQEVNVEDLPKNWTNIPPTTSTQYIGDDFVKDGVAAVLRVPSCIIPEESNYLINPTHPDSKNISVKRTRPFKFDSRLKN